MEQVADKTTIKTQTGEQIIETVADKINPIEDFSEFRSKVQL